MARPAWGFRPSVLGSIGLRGRLFFSLHLGGRYLQANGTSTPSLVLQHGALGVLAFTLREQAVVVGVRELPPLGAVDYSPPAHSIMAPLDHKTKTRTRPGRLRSVDDYVVRYERDLLSARERLFVDVGFGMSPCTTVETATRLRQEGLGAYVIGVERDNALVEQAQACGGPGLEFREGGFALPLRPPERPSIIRVMNVLRGYRAEAVPEVHARLGEQLADRGLLVEGSSDTTGGVLVCHLIRKHASSLTREGMLFFTDFSHGFAPILFRDWLPRDLRRKAGHGQSVGELLARWTAHWQAVRPGANRNPETAFRLSAERFAAHEPEVSLLAPGMLLWRCALPC